MKVLAYVEPSGRAVLELAPRPEGEWVEVEVREAERRTAADLVRDYDGPGVFEDKDDIAAWLRAERDADR